MASYAPYGAELEFMPIEAFGGRMKPMASAISNMGMTYHKGGLGAILGIVASIAIPFAAPAIAQSIGLSAALGNTLGSAVVGLGLGAAKGAVLGEDIFKSGLMGAIGGGLAGYSAPVSSGSGITAGGAAGAGTGATLSSGGAGLGLGGANFMGAPVSGAIGFQGGAGALGAITPASLAPYAGGVSGGAAASGLGSALSNVGNVAGDAAAAASNTGMASAGYTPGSADYWAQGRVPTTSTAGLSTTPSQMPVDVAGATPVSTSAPVSTAGGFRIPDTYSASMQPVSLGGQPQPGVLERVGTSLKTAATNAAQSITDPKRLADFALRAAGNLAGNALAGSGLSPEEQAFLDEQTKELRQLKDTNYALFQQRLQAAQDLLGQARYFDPNYYGLQSANRAQIAVARQKEEALSQLPQRSTGLRESTARRFNIESGRRTGTAYDVGFGTGMENQTRLTQAGLSQMPQSAPQIYTSGVGQAYSSTLANAEQRRQAEVDDYNKMFGNMFFSNPTQAGR